MFFFATSRKFRKLSWHTGCPCLCSYYAFLENWNFLGFLLSRLFHVVIACGSLSIVSDSDHHYNFGCSLTMVAIIVSISPFSSEHLYLVILGPWFILITCGLHLLHFEVGLDFSLTTLLHSDKPYDCMAFCLLFCCNHCCLVHFLCFGLFTN